MGKRQHPDAAIRTAVMAADRRTKHLCKRLHSHQFALLDHPDVDEMAASSLLDSEVKIVINLSPFMTGHYPAEGARMLLNAGVSLYEIPTGICEHDLIELLDGEYVTIHEETLFVHSPAGWTFVSALHKVTAASIQLKWVEAQSKLDDTLSLFIDNTLSYARQEKNLFLKPLYPVPLRTRLENRHVVVVARGKHYKQDLHTLASYIRECRPVLIGVDGGADALLQYGYVPDLIIGDMDSVSDKALLCGAEIVVHAFVDGTAPGQKRIERLGLPFHLLPAPGTSEDVAMLLAYEKRAQLIVTIGAHTNMIDFLEKGRKGMASTLLVRTKIGNKLVDAKGVSQLYQPSGSWKVWGFCIAAMLLPVTSALMINPVARHAAQMLWTQWRTWAF
ncbi:putative cytokinetic ring protein SteA [Brevibacillus sp. NRS-1366]|uniref:putative cytokinetic ring protein SteA n=1 Tax=Brevibacillus sp. NRS-1366 TaxID=3233899 RepID=UPI003D1D38C0